MTLPVEQAPATDPGRVASVKIVCAPDSFKESMTAVQAAESVSAKGFGDRIWTADGNWLVVDLVASARVEAASLGLATLTVDGRTWTASERPTSMRQEWLQPGLGRSGSLAFELPASLRSGAGQLRLGMGSLGAELDSQLVLPIDLGELPLEPRDVTLVAVVAAGLVEYLHEHT